MFPKHTYALATLLALTAGCSDTQDAPDSEPHTVSYQLVTTLAAGVEAEHCKFVRAPADGMLVQRDEVRYTEGSHHFLLYTTPYEEIPTTDDNDEPLAYLDEEQGVFDCSQGVQFGLSVTQLIGGSQNADGASVVNFPEGVAMRVPPDTVLLMNAHYINATTSELTPTVDITLETIEQEALEQEGSVLFWYNLFIKVPGQSEAHATTICDIPHDTTLSNAQSHMHARGVDYSATVIDPSGERTEMYSNTKWENVPVETFDGGRPIEAGSRIEYTCHYDNASTETVYQGPRTTDEMCMFIGSYYPSKPEVDLCSRKVDAPYETNFFGAEWIGQGTTSCADSLTCMQGSLGGGDPIETLQAISECVVASDPSVSVELSDAIGCTFAGFLTGENPFEACQPDYDACLAK